MWGLRAPIVGILNPSQIWITLGSVFMETTKCSYMYIGVYWLQRFHEMEHYMSSGES